MDVTPLVWWTTILVTSAILIFDVFVIGRRPHEPSRRRWSPRCRSTSALAVSSGSACGTSPAAQYGGEFFAGWLTEYSLSIDNLFIFIVIMGKLAVPRELPAERADGRDRARPGPARHLHRRRRRRDRQFSWVFYLFGLFLVGTAFNLAARPATTTGGYDEPRLVRFARRHLPFTDDWNGAKLTVRENGSRLFTPMFLVVLTLGVTDLLFALDSIPAIYGLTTSPTWC